MSEEVAACRASQAHSMVPSRVGSDFPMVSLADQLLRVHLPQRPLCHLTGVTGVIQLRSHIFHVGTHFLGGYTSRLPLFMLLAAIACIRYKAAAYTSLLRCKTHVRGQLLQCSMNCSGVW